MILNKDNFILLNKKKFVKFPVITTKLTTENTVLKFIKRQISTMVFLLFSDALAAYMLTLRETLNLLLVRMTFWC